MNPYAQGYTGGGDQYFNSVILLMHMNGSNAGTTFTDSSNSPATVTGSDNAQTSTGQSKFNGSSLLLDGTNDRLRADDSKLAIGSGDLTVECWARFNSLSGNPQIWTSINTANTAVNAFLGTNSSITGKFRFVIRSDIGLTNIDLESTLAAPSTSTWYHLAATVSGTTARLFVDGALADTGTLSGTRSGTGTACNIGVETPPNSRPVNGNIAELRVTKGIARYTAAFTAPSAAFPDFY